jgi:DNA-directed RNA polymerase subunit M/transcription elongation factor TFIIS
MKYFGQTDNYILTECENCNTTLKIAKSLCINKGNNNYDISEIIKCDKCGQESDKIIKPIKEKKGFWKNVKEGFNDIAQHEENKKAMQKAKAQEPIRCPKCGSTQITANKKVSVLARQ